jgi:multimeric flavodoxin WrbA
MSALRRVAVLNGSPVRGSSVDLLLEALVDGARAAGGEADVIHCDEIGVRACTACGPDATSGFCVYHDGMDRVYEALEKAHAVVVGSPVYFDTVSGPLKLVMDRCNCITPLVTLPDGSEDCVPKWARTRRGVFVTACSSDHTYELAERTVRGFLKWVGAKWEETIAWQHPDNRHGSVAGDRLLLERARTAGRRLLESPPLAP